MRPEHNHLGFLVENARLERNVLIPRYYNPEIPRTLARLRESHDLTILRDIVDKGFLETSTGDEIGKMAYGTGNIPFVRTSDISNWEIKTDPKQGVSEEIYQFYAEKQDVRPGDLLFVRDGTYLIGASCIVSEIDSKMLYQSHLLKFRISKKSPISAPLMLALLSSPIVRKQIRSKQFTADIIDTIGNRFLELVLPVPKDRPKKNRIESQVLAIVKERVRLREILRKLPLLAEGIIRDFSETPSLSDETIDSTRNLGFLTASNLVRSNTLIPRYYNPSIDNGLKKLSKTHDLVTIADLLEENVLLADTGVEVGKMAYGTGEIPFIRTSDISNWELRVDPKQCVSEEIYSEYKDQLRVMEDDVFVVRDGTYLVGTSCILTDHDTKLLYCGGIYKLRVMKQEVLDPYLLIVLLNCPIVKRQMRSKQFTRDVIDTLGKRLFEIVLPIPKNLSLRKKIAEMARRAVQTRVDLRNRAKQIAMSVAEDHVIEIPAEEKEELLVTL